MKKLNLLLMTLMLGSLTAQAETISFPLAWDQINKSSAAQAGSRLQTEALTQGQARVSRHWLPKVYLDAKSYQTNDPGASFFGLLQQRSLTATDFNADSINHPEAHVYTRGALGIDLPLFEGGMKSAQADMMKYSLEAQKNMSSQIQLEQYSQTGLAYGSILILEEQKARIEMLSNEISRMIKNYQLGNRSNPVGYSGLLGMKSLANRLTGLASQYRSQSKAYRASLTEMGLSAQEWQPTANLEASDFVTRYLLPSASGDKMKPSFKSAAISESVKASNEGSNMEKARFLPKVGAFAETYVFNGNRATANGYNAGLYLQWSLYDPSDYGSLNESRLKSQAAAKNSEASDQQERAEKAGLVETMQSLQENIQLLNDSYRLLIEQSKMTETLFRNGSINALQMVEILNRRTELVVQQGESQLGLVKAAAILITKTDFNVADRVMDQKSVGVKK